MPQKKTLFDTCMAFITKNIDLWPYQGGSNGGTHLQFGSFYQLPSALLKALNDAICIGNSPPSSFEPFMNPTADALELKNHTSFLSKTMDENFIHLLNVLALRCPELKSLKLDIAWPTGDDYQISYHGLFKFVPKLSKLQILEISPNLYFGDNDLLLLGKQCKDLRVLVANGCPNITNLGIQGLCVDYVDSSGIAGGQCKLIHLLEIIRTSVSEGGTLIALRHLLHLRILKCDWTVYTLAGMQRNKSNDIVGFHWDSEVVNQPKLTHLRHADCYWDDCSTVTLTKAIEFIDSSFISTVSIEISTQMKNEALLPLLNLKSLTDLHIFSTEEYSSDLTLEGGVLPILQSIGKSLQSFRLEKFPVSNFSFISILCPNLQRLELVLNRGEIIPCTVPCGLKMLQLRHLVICQDDGFRRQKCITTEHFDIFFSSPALVHIEIYGCEGLNDGVFERANALHSFRHLESLQIFECANVTSRSIEILMNEDNALKCITLSFDVAIKFGDKLMWIKEKAVRENWKLRYEIVGLEYNRRFAGKIIM